MPVSACVVNRNILFWYYTHIYIEAAGPPARVLHTHTHTQIHHVWRDSFMCDVTHSYVWRDSFICVTWLIHMCDVTHSYVWHDSFIYNMILVIYNMTLVHVRHQSHKWIGHVCDKLIHMCNATHSYVWHEWFMCVTWMNHMRCIMHTYKRVVSASIAHSFTHTNESHVPSHIRLIHMCGMTHSYMWHWVSCSVSQRVVVYCSVLQCVAARCSVWQYVAICCSVLQCAAFLPNIDTHLIAAVGFVIFRQPQCSATPTHNCSAVSHVGHIHPYIARLACCCIGLFVCASNTRTYTHIS